MVMQTQSFVESILYLLTIIANIVVPLTLLSALASFHLCLLQLHFSVFWPIMFVANNLWLLTRRTLTQTQLWSDVFQALPFHYSSEYKVGLHFLTQWRHSKHPKCLMYWCRSLAPMQKCETLRHQTHSAEMSWVRSVLDPKCTRTPKGHNLSNWSSTKSKVQLLYSAPESWPQRAGLLSLPHLGIFAIHTR